MRFITFTEITDGWYDAKAHEVHIEGYIEIDREIRKALIEEGEDFSPYAPYDYVLDMNDDAHYNHWKGFIVKRNKLINENGLLGEKNDVLAKALVGQHISVGVKEDLEEAYTIWCQKNRK